VNKSSLLVVGSVALDSVETRAGKRVEVLGGAATYFSVAASFLAPTPVRLTGVVGDDFADAHTQLLESRGVDIAGLERVKGGRTFRWAGVYAPDFSTRTTLDTQLNVFQDFNPKLPAGWADSDFVFLANIDPVLQLGVLEQAKKPKFVACDTMNLWIDIKRPELVKLLERVDMLLLNDEEARQLSGQANLPAAARAIRAMGPGSVVIKRGDAGALLFHGGGAFAAPAMPLADVKDPTGAGDSFAGGLMGYLAYAGDLSPSTIRTAMIMGSVMGSFAVEQFSVDGLRGLTTARIQQRFDELAELAHFERVRL
jgi:sugar/nucleoside kinase (ribokinase family)